MWCVLSGSIACFYFFTNEARAEAMFIDIDLKDFNLKMMVTNPTLLSE